MIQTKPILFLILIISISCFSCANDGHKIIPYSSDQIVYSGRIDSSSGEHADLFWPGSTIKINFEGESIAALLKDEHGENYYNIIVDNQSPYTLHMDTSKRLYTLATGLPKGEHSVEIFKRTEWDKGKTAFYGIQIDEDAKILAAKPYTRSIEFYGNSITAGYAVEDTSGMDSPDSTYTNNYLSYAAITARHFDAKYQCICRSGIGMTVSWNPLIMPELFDRLNPFDSTKKWDFSYDKPEIVVINLFQNDSWLVNLPEFEEYKKRFGAIKPTEAFLVNAYSQFLGQIRSRYPEAHIICSLGCMDAAKNDSPWKDYITKAVNQRNDEKIYTHFMPFIASKTHPTVTDQQTMANHLITFIEDNISW